MIQEGGGKPPPSLEENDMDSLDRRLIELNQALLKLTKGEIVDDEILQRAEQVLSGAIIQTGPGNDTIIINGVDDDCTPGQQGPQGPQGESGVCLCNAVLVSNNYVVEANVTYVGVNSDSPTTITLPSVTGDCFEIIIKAEMDAPVGNRKVTVNTNDGSTIDGKNEYIMETPWESLTLVYRDGNWFIV